MNMEGLPEYLNSTEVKALTGLAPNQAYALIFQLNPIKLYNDETFESTGKDGRKPKYLIDTQALMEKLWLDAQDMATVLSALDEGRILPSLYAGAEAVAEILHTDQKTAKDIIKSANKMMEEDGGYVVSKRKVNLRYFQRIQHKFDLTKSEEGDKNE